MMSDVSIIINKPDYGKIGKIGLGNSLKGFISLLSVFDNVKLECNDNYIYGRFNKILTDKFIYNGDTNDTNTIIKTGSWRWLIQLSEVNIQPLLKNEFSWIDCDIKNDEFLNKYFSINNHIDCYYEPSLIAESIRERILKTINKLEYVPEIKTNILEYSNKINFDNSLGISVRTWKASHETNINRSYSFDEYKNAIKNVISENNIDNVIISIDNDEYLDNYINLFSSLNINCTILQNNNNLDDIQFVLIKILILSKCNYLIGNRISTFTELVFWFSNLNIKVTTVF